MQNNLKDITSNTVQQQYLNLDDMTEETKLAYVDFKNDTSVKPFDIGNDNDPESEASEYSLHKRGVIKNSIQHNLNTAISTFNDTYYGSPDDLDLGIAYRLPILKAEDWESVLNNVCMVSFMQGIPCGTKRFNSYSVIKSNNNNTSVNIENMCFVDEEKVDDSQTDYHLYDCPDLKGDSYYADQSAEFKYDAKKITAKVADVNSTDIVCFYDSETNKYYEPTTIAGTNKITIGPEIEDFSAYTGLPNGNNAIYIYDHKNTGCYNCIVSRNYEPIVRWYEGDLRRIASTEDNELIIEMSTGNWIYEKDGKTAPTPISTNIGCAPEELDRRKKQYILI